MDAFFLSNWFYVALKWFYENIVGGGGAYAITIILFTILLKIAMLPFDIKQRKSSQKMAELAPELEKLKKKYGGDPKKMQEMQSALYKKNGVSMLSSCLPMLLTLPIFIAFLGAMRIWANENLIRMVLDLHNGSMATFDSFNWLWVHNIFQPDSGMAPVVMAAKDFQALPFDTFTMFPQQTIDLIKSLAPNYDAIVQPVIDRFTINGTQYMNGYFILPLFAGASNYLSSWVQRKLNPGSQQAMGKGMTLVFAGISVWVCLTANTAFAIYWVISNICALALQLVLGRVYKTNDGSTKLPEGGAK